MCRLGNIFKGRNKVEDSIKRITHEIRRGSCPKCDSLRVIVSKIPCYNSKDVIIGHVNSYGCLDCGHNWEVVKVDC